jgi:hypothetical protein
MITQCADRSLNALVTGISIVIVSVRRSVIFMRNTYSQELLETCILCFISVSDVMAGLCVQPVSLTYTYICIRESPDNEVNE